MEQIISAILHGVIWALIPYTFYCLIRNNSFKLLRVYMVFYTAFIFIPLLNILFAEELDILGAIVQIVTIIIIIYLIWGVFKKDCLYENLYKTMAIGRIMPMIVIGISTIDIKEIEYYKKRFQCINEEISQLTKNAYAYISFKENYLEISLIVTNINDYEKLHDLKFEDSNITIKDSEHTHRGGSVTIVIVSNTGKGCVEY